MKEQEALVPLSCGAQTKRPRGIRSSDKKPQDKTSLGMFCPWEVLSLGSFVPWDVLFQRRFVLGRFVLGRFLCASFMLQYFS